MAVSGSFTIQQAMQAQAASNWPFAGPYPYIEDVFSTYLYTGTSANQTITNDIDLAGEGGLVWIKDRSGGANSFTDTVRGAGNYLVSNTTSASTNNTSTVTSFNSNGFSLGSDSSNSFNYTGDPLVSWTFRKQAKFFDVVTYTGNDNSSRVVSHALQSQPGLIIIKRTSGVQNWVAIASDGAGNYSLLYLNSTSAQLGSTTQSYVASSTGINIGWISNNWVGVNTTGETFVIYIYASNAGGFGLTGTDNVISCGSFTTDSSGNADINLGYEPQYILVKGINTTRNWWVFDVMRGMSYADTLGLQPNTAIAEYDFGQGICLPTATGFNARSFDSAGVTWVYMAIRRPMKVPTIATTVFNPIVGDGNYPPAYTSSNFNAGVDSAIQFYTPGYSTYPNWQSRLTGTDQLSTPLTSAATTISFNKWDYMNGYNSYPGLSSIYGAWMFVRRPGFFDVVVLNSSQNTYNNLLGVAPNMILVKCTNASGANWVVYHDGLSDPTNQYLRLNTTAAVSGYSGAWAVSSTTFTVQSGLWANGTAGIAYLFATCPGVSKVGSYTGTGSTQTINCGFTGGARFVLIKRTDSTGDWYVWDTTRGMVAGTDPSFSLNSTGAQVNANSVYSVTTGFQLLASPSADVNTSGGSYIFLAIA